MVENDLIRRYTVLGTLIANYVVGNLTEEALQLYTQEINDIPAVPHEMSAREYVRELLSLQNKRKTNCTLDDMLAFLDWEDAIAVGNVDDAVAIIEKWSREHPEETEEMQ